MLSTVHTAYLSAAGPVLTQLGPGSPVARLGRRSSTPLPPG